MGKRGIAYGILEISRFGQCKRLSAADFIKLMIYRVGENTSIIARSLPCLKPLFVHILGSTYGRGTNSRQMYHTQSKSGRPASSRIFSTLGSRSILEDSESQSRFGISDEAHMITDMGKGKLDAHAVVRQSGEDSLEMLAQGRVPGQAIIKTTTTTVASYRRDGLADSFQGPRAGVPGLGKAL